MSLCIQNTFISNLRFCLCQLNTQLTYFFIGVQWEQNGIQNTELVNLVLDIFVCTLIKAKKPIISTEITIKTNPLFCKIRTSTSFSTWTSILLTEVVMYQETDRFQNNFSYLTEKKGSIRFVALSWMCMYIATWRKKLPWYFQWKKVANYK